MQTMLQGCGKSGAEGAWAPQFLSEQLPYLNQGADYAHHSTTSTPRIFITCNDPVMCYIQSRNVNAVQESRVSEAGGKGAMALQV